MPDVTVTVDSHVFPSANDLDGAEPDGWGESIYEKNLGPNWMANAVPRNFVVSGFLLPASDADLTMTIPLGVAFISGRYVRVSTGTAITFPASSTSHVFLKFSLDVNSQVADVKFEHNTTGVAPADAVKIGQVVTSASAVTSTVDQRNLILGPVLFDDLMGNGVLASTIWTSRHRWEKITGGTPVTATDWVLDLADSVTENLEFELAGRYAFFKASLAVDLTVRWCRRHNSATPTPRIGLFGATGSGDPADGIFFRQAGTANNVFAVCRAASSESTLDLGISMAQNVFHEMRLRAYDNGTKVDLYLNGELKGTISSNVPTAGLWPGMRGGSNIGGSIMGVHFVKVTQWRQ